MWGGFNDELRETIVGELNEFANDTEFPIKPQKIISDLRAVLNPEDVVISDVGAHKMWVARMYQAEEPNTCIIFQWVCLYGHRCTRCYSS